MHVGVGASAADAGVVSKRQAKSNKKTNMSGFIVSEGEYRVYYRLCQEVVNKVLEKSLFLCYHPCMMTPQAQIKLNLPLQLKEYVETKANKLGVPLAAYIKHLIINDVKDVAYPTFHLSKRSEKRLEEALKEQGSAVEVEDVFEYFKK